MLTINLLPEGLRKPPPTAIEQFYRMPLMWVILACLGVLAMIPALQVGVRTRRLASLERRVETLTPKKAAVEQTQQVNQVLDAQRRAFQGLTHENLRWWKRLNTLSDVTPGGVWFTELALDLKSGLVIQGSAIGDERGSEMERVHRFVQDLKGDASFATVVKDIQIESIKRVQDKEIELVRFTITGSLATP